jgi:hypothetical protein
MLALAVELNSEMMLIQVIVLSLLLLLKHIRCSLKLYLQLKHRIITDDWPPLSYMTRYTFSVFSFKSLNTFYT